jgi:cell division protein FtsQ
MVFGVRLIIGLSRLALQTVRRRRARLPQQRPGLRERLRRLFPHWPSRFLGRRLPRFAGVNASAILILATVAYGTGLGGHWPLVVDAVKDARDIAANASGFHITAVAISGHKHVARDDILAMAGVTERTSLLFLDAEAARQKLKTNPWIADATVLKLYPDRLQIGITERQAFALWQKNGQLSVIAEDGTVLEPYVARRFTGLPLVVGAGARERARDILALIDRHPEISASVAATVLVAQRRWNLRLKNGIDVRLPETDVDTALATLVDLDREKKLLSRDITAIDLRMPDRVTVRLSDEAAQAREGALKPKSKRKGGAV